MKLAHYKFFFLVIFVFILGQASPQKMYLQDYLKSKYLGKVMTYQDERFQNKLFKSKVANVFSTEDSFFLKLKNGIFLKFQFVAYGSSREPDMRQSQKSFFAKAQALQAQDYINASLRNVGSDSDSGISESSMMSNFNTNISEYSKKNVFTTVNKIHYTEPKVNAVLEDLFVVQLDGLYLLDGTRINIFYERWDIEKEN